MIFQPFYFTLVIIIIFIICITINFYSPKPKYDTNKKSHKNLSTPENRSKEKVNLRLVSEYETNKSIFSSISRSIRAEQDSSKNPVFSFSSGKKSKTVTNIPMTSSTKPDQVNDLKETGLDRLNSEQLSISDSINESECLDKKEQLETLKRKRIALDLIQKKIQAKTCEEPYKGTDLCTEEDKDLHERHSGEVNKFLWLIFHDLNLRGMNDIILVIVFIHSEGVVDIKYLEY